MRHLVHVISDLHLGGSPASDSTPAFQMCRPRTHALLADFVDRLPASSADRQSHLVIAGDIVDFLAEAPFQAFTPDPVAACVKLQRIFDSTTPVWDALSRFAAQRAGVLTLMLGNHDIELSLPGVRQMFLDRVQGAHVRFIYDNEAFTLGPLLIEHGNRFDAWNAVPHGALRRVRSQLSRKQEVAPEFISLPGSRMVVDVINPLKRDYPFIDLLKPETGVALPLAAALGAVGLQQVWDGFNQFKAARAVDFDEASGEPVNPDLVSARWSDDDRLWLAAQEMTEGPDRQYVSAVGDLLKKGAGAISASVRTARIDAVFMALRKLVSLRKMHSDTFDVEREADTYLKPARNSARAGFKVIVYGHTHLPKRVRIELADRAPALYLNTGTWADLMCVPESIWNTDEAAGRDAFRRFAGDLGANSLERWRRTVPTYARMEIAGDELLSADVHFADNDAAVSTASLMARLAAVEEA